MFLVINYKILQCHDSWTWLISRFLSHFNLNYFFIVFSLMYCFYFFIDPVVSIFPLFINRLQGNFSKMKRVNPAQAHIVSKGFHLSIIWCFIVSSSWPWVFMQLPTLTFNTNLYNLKHVHTHKYNSWCLYHIYTLQLCV